MCKEGYETSYKEGDKEGDKTKCKEGYEASYKERENQRQKNSLLRHTIIKLNEMTLNTKCI